MTRTFTLFAFLALIFISSVNSNCIHDDLDIQLEEVTLEEEGDHRVLATSYGGLRMVADFSKLSASSTVESYIQNKLIPAAFNFFKAALQVPNLSNLKLSTTSACGLSIPSKYRTTGVQADILIFVTAESTSESWLAWAKPCQQLSGTRRPIVGQINFNTKGISSGSYFDFESDLLVTMHELSHVLGFSKSLYNSWPGSGSVKSKTVNGNTVNYIDAPKLKETIREHFGCDTAVGAYLENQGGSGSAGSHFERRVFFNEYMTASEIKDARITKFTLSLFESTGWYKVNYDMAEPTFWGYKDGCGFLDSKCIQSKSAAFGEFCSSMGSYGCYHTGGYGGYCGNTRVSKASSMDNDIDYFGDNRVVLDKFADNCPFVRPYANMHCEDANDESGAYLSAEAYGTGSKCFMGTLYSGSSGLKSSRPYCFKYECDSNDGDYTLTVKVGSKNAVCKEKGDLKVSGYAGVLKCPDPKTYCTTIGKKFCKRGCMGKGTCTSSKTCDCDSGWGKIDCSQKTTTNIEEDPEVYDDASNADEGN